MSNPKSTASIVGHPLHPMLVEFPIALFVGAFVSDLIFWQTTNSFWASASFWLLGAGLVIAVFAAAAGVVDFLGEPKIRSLNDAWWHAGCNVFAVLLQLCNWLLRYQSGEAAIVPTGLFLSLAVVCILVFTGWKGGNSSISIASRFLTNTVKVKSLHAKQSQAADKSARSLEWPS
jgi:uncharacterized membrane protein